MEPPDPPDARHVDGPEPSSSVTAGSSKCLGRRGRVTWGAAESVGRRSEMEDASAADPEFLAVSCSATGGCAAATGESDEVSKLRFFGVYDGHGGSQVANYCARRMHGAIAEEWGRAGTNEEQGDEKWKTRWETAFLNGFQRVDDEIIADVIAPDVVGSTAVLAVVSDCQIICANCGDSRAILCRPFKAIPLTVDHKPDRADELARIESTGGRVVIWGIPRVSAILAMSRAIGDRYMRPWVIPVPEITFQQRTEEDECLVLASDGLFDVLSNEEVASYSARLIKKLRRNSITDGENPITPAQGVADFLLRMAYRKNSSDNISVIVVDLKSRTRRRQPKE